MNYPESVRFLYALGNEYKTAKLGLDRIRLLLSALGDPHERVSFVHVAGTNGKGSTCALIESALRAAGQRTGLYTSPHLVSPTERIRLQGRPVPEDAFAEAFNRVHEAALSLMARGEIDLHPTYFETVTAMAFGLFADAGVETAVLEVGLGGRLDATNVVTPRLCVITPVDFDHQEFLGSSLESIASEKAGILKPPAPAVIAKQRPEAQAAVEACAASRKVELIHAGSIQNLELHATGSRFRLGEQWIECPLAGEHQAENAATAFAALQRLGISAPDIAQGIAQTRWPGRMELVSRNPDILLDGAHNPAGAKALAGYLRRFGARRRLRLIFGVMREKAAAEMAAELFPLAWEVIPVAPHQVRALPAEAIRQLSPHPRMRAAASLASALEAARTGAAPGDWIVITGSLFLVGEARALLLPEALI